jgi:hypothetical protein
MKKEKIHMSTMLSEEKFSLLEVEWVEETPHIRMKDDTFHKVVQRKVSLVSPASRWSQKVRIVNISARTALALLHWLETEQVTLEELAQDEMQVDQQKMFP